MRSLSIAVLLALVSTPALAADVAVIVRFHGNGKADGRIFARLGGKARIDLGDGRAVAGRVPASKLKALRALPGVASVSVDAIATALGKPAPAPAGESTPWGIANVNAPSVWAATKGSGVRVAVIDTGIDGTHPDLAGNVTGGKSYYNNGNPADDHGHGTHVAGTIGALDNDIGVVGVAPEATLVPVKVLDASGSGYYSDVIAGINWAVANADVINMSLGGPADDSLHAAVDDAAAAGVFVACAAGNDGNMPIVSYPGGYDSTVAVAAIDSRNRVARFSTRGDYVDVSAPGVSVLSTWLGGGYNTISGTSMATPHVAGAAALLRDLGHTSAGARARLESTARDLGTAGLDSSYGWGAIDVAAAAQP